MNAIFNHLLPRKSQAMGARWSRDKGNAWRKIRNVPENQGHLTGWAVSRGVYSFIRIIESKRSLYWGCSRALPFLHQCHFLPQQQQNFCKKCRTFKGGDLLPPKDLRLLSLWEFQCHSSWWRKGTQTCDSDVHRTTKARIKPQRLTRCCDLCCSNWCLIFYIL